MSRCFPFPPPGYEKKPRSDHADLLAKEKHKEKKHKKEKKDKDKREGEERKDKDKSKDKKDKHKEKKDRKDKHKDKKRDKDRDKDKNRSSDDKRIEEWTEGHNEDKPGDASRKAEDVKDSKFTEELGRRIRDEEKGAANRMLENFTGSIQRRLDNMGNATAVSDAIKNRMGSIGTATEMEKERAMENNVVPNLVSTEQRRAFGNETAPNLISTEQRRAVGNEMDPKLVSTEQRRAVGDEMAPIPIRTEQRRAIGNEMVPTPTSTDQRRNDRVARLVEDMEKKIEGKEKGKDTETDQRRNDRVARLVEDMEKKIEGKEKGKDTEASDGKRDRHKDRDREDKRDKGKDKHKHKEKEKEKEKTRDKGEHKHREHDKAKDNNGRKDQLDGLRCKPLAPHSGNGKSTHSDENIKKRKHIEMNGFLQEDDTRPNKFPRPASSSYLPVENGRTLQSCHIAPAPHSITKEGAVNNIKADRVQDNKDQRINGISEALPSSIDFRPSIAVEKRENGDGSSKRPQPDSKFLSQIYSIPKMDEWPEFDDQEWLFGSKNLRPKPEAEFEAEETPQVWAEALQIDSADVLALPYVVPY